MWLFVRVSLQNLAAYRFDMYARIAMAFMHVGYEILCVWIIFNRTDAIGGWGVNQMLVLVGVFRMVAGGIRIIIVPNMRLLLQDIHNGKLDFVLLKPVDAQFLVSVREFVVWRFTDVLLGASVALYGCLKLTGSLSPEALLRFAITLTAACAIVYSVWLMLATVCFWFVRIENIEMVFWNVFEAGRYPVVIYRPWVRGLLTFVIPLAFITTVPAAALSGEDSTIVPYAPLVAAGAGVGMLLLSSWFWRFGLRHYSGASA